MTADKAIRTPSFLAWSVLQNCSLRKKAASQNPLTIERHLRPVRCWSTGLHQGHICDDVCVAMVDKEEGTEPSVVGFPVAETLRRYGGADQISSICGECPANVNVEDQVHSVAGCYGWLVLTPGNVRELENLWGAVKQSNELLSACQAHFPRTSPPWYGLLVPSRLQGSSLETLHRVLSGIDSTPDELGSNDRTTASQSADEPDGDSLNRFAVAVATAVEHDLELQCELVPSGSRVGRTWTIDPHCDRCRSSRAVESTRCSVCGKSGGAAPPSQRRARGLRPFMPLEVFLGEAQASELRRRCAEKNRET